MDDRQLGWVSKNRRRRAERADRAVSIGALSQNLLASPQFRGPAWRRRLIGVIEESAGPELLEHATITSIRNGVLTLQIADPAICYHLRLQWEQRLLQLLQYRLPEAGVNAIRFVASASK